MPLAPALSCGLRFSWGTLANRYAAIACLGLEARVGAATAETVDNALHKLLVDATHELGVVLRQVIEWAVA